MHPQLIEFSQEKPLNLIEKGIDKGPIHVVVDGFITSSMAKGYYSHVFWGTLPARDGMDLMYVVGIAEQYKNEDFIRAEQVKLFRCYDRKPLAALANGLNDELRK